MGSTISCPHSMSRYTWKIRGKGGLSFELDMWAGRKGWGGLCKPERECRTLQTEETKQEERASLRKSKLPEAECCSALCPEEQERQVVAHLASFQKAEEAEHRSAF